MPIPSGYDSPDTSFTTLSEPCYVTRERVQRTLDAADTFRTNQVIDDAINAASRDLEAELHRYFYPVTARRYPDPWRQIHSDVLWLDSSTYEVCAVTALTLDGEAAVEGTDFYLDPEDGPPYTSIRLFRDASVSWPSDERSIVLDGEIGASNATAAAGTLDGIVSDSAVTMTISNSSLIGVGDLVTADLERVVVTGKTMVATGATLSTGVGVLASAVTLPVSDGTLVNAGEMIQVDAERMYVESVSGDNVVVKRAVNGSVLAEHDTGAAISAPRVCTVERACTGTTAASHADGATLRINRPPSLITMATLALAVDHMGLGSGYVNADGANTAAVVERARAAHGRMRIGATSWNS